VVLVGLRRRPTRTFTGLARRSAQGQLSTVVIIEAGDRLESLEGAESDLYGDWSQKSRDKGPAEGGGRRLDSTGLPSLAKSRLLGRTGLARAQNECLKR
jgi:hypothetical protein